MPETLEAKPADADQYTVGAEPAPPPPAEPTPEPAPTPPPPRHDRAVERLALDFGWSREDIDATPPEALRNSVLRESARLRAEQVAESHHPWNQQPSSLPAPAASPAAGAQPPPASGGPEGVSSLELPNLDYLDPSIAKFLQGLLESHRALLESHRVLEGHVEGLGRREMARATETFAQHADRRFAERPDIFGKVNVRTVQKGSAEAIRRLAVIDAVKALGPWAGFDAWDERYDQVVSALYGASPGKPAAAEPAEPSPRQTPPRDPSTGRFTAEDWTSGGLAVPTQRKGGAEPTGAARAEESVRKWQQENGVVAATTDISREFLD